MFQTEHEFRLPFGYVDEEGTLHRDGVMRLATAADEILPLRDPRVAANQAYLVIILLSLVLARLGILTDGIVSAGVVELLFSAALSYLEGFYRRFNEIGHTRVAATCPSC